MASMGKITGAYGKHGGDNRCIWQAYGEITGAYGKHGGDNRCIWKAWG